MEASLYREVEKKTIENFNLRCIDGSIHGCGKCVGYCAYEGHAGFLTAELRKEHQCIEKGCFHYSPKPRGLKNSCNDNAALQQKIFLIARATTAAMEGLRVIRVAVESDKNCIVHYAAIAQYDVSPVVAAIEASTGSRVTMKQIPCDFDVAVALVMA